MGNPSHGYFAMSRIRRFLARITTPLIVAGLIAALGFWWYQTSRPGYRLQQGQAALFRGDADEAERLADKLLASGYADHAHLLRGQIYLHLNRLNPAIEEYNQIRPENEAILAEASLVYGLGLLSKGMAGRAEKLLLYVTQVQPDNVDARRGLAAIYFDRGAVNKALTQLNKWSQLDDADGEPHRFMGVIYKDYTSDEFAVEQFQAALERHLPPAIREEVVIDLAEVFLKRTQFAEALACLDRGPLETAKARAAAPEVRAAALYGLGRGVDAAHLLEALLDAESPSPRALRLRAQLYVEASDYPAAARLLEKALRVDPHDPMCRFQLATVYEFLGRRQDAAEQRRLLDETQKLIADLGDLSKEANQKPTDVAVRRRLAEVCQQLGKFELAQTWRRAADSCQTEDQPDENHKSQIPNPKSESPH